MHSQLQPHNRLSARYINNKPQAMPTSNNRRVGTSPAKMSTNITSKLICNCEKQENDLTPPSSTDSMKSQLLKHMPKRLISTRNAATSPNLDLRRSDNKIMYITKQTNNNHNKLNLEKSNSLTENKPQKLLRNTRSLSPRPPVRHQHAILVSDESETGAAPVYAVTSSKEASSSPLRYIKVLGHSRSEQTSPNKSDLSVSSFQYHDVTNKSTECLTKTATDPWLRIHESGSVLLGGSLTLAKEPIQTASASKDLFNDPWVKRTDTLQVQTAKQQQFRQTKSFSATRKLPQLPREFTLPVCPPLQSAPSSPNYLSVNNNFSTAFSLTHLGSGGSQGSSPVKTKQTLNPFLDIGHASLRLKPLLATCNGLQQQQPARRTHLDIHPPVASLQARHSFTALCSEQPETFTIESELQLNIRRLSEQMRKARHCAEESEKGEQRAQLSASERNINQPLNVSIIQLNSGGADFTEYLQQQFPCNSVSSKSFGSNLRTQPTAKDDKLLETTC